MCVRCQRTTALPAPVQRRISLFYTFLPWGFSLLSFPGDLLTFLEAPFLSNWLEANPVDGEEMASPESFPTRPSSPLWEKQTEDKDRGLKQKTGLAVVLECVMGPLDAPGGPPLRVHARV